MKKIFLIVLALIVSKDELVAQLTLQPTVPAVGLIQKNQLWNVLVINSSNNTYNDCRLNLILKDRLTGQEIFTATTAMFAITRGAKQLNINALNPIQYNYLSGMANNNLQGIISAGTYTACYSLTGYLLKESSLAEECIQFDAEPLSPPMLIFPTDSSILDNAPNQFTWTPPTPVIMFDRLHYDMIITEIQPQQKADEAIQQNIPFYSEAGVLNNVLNYSGTASQFEKDKWYAWQIVAKDDRSYAGKSEVWVFKIKNEKKEIKPVSDVYLLLDETRKGAYLITNGMLHIKYMSPTMEYEGQVVFSEGKNTIKVDKRKILQGENYFDFSLSNRFHSNKIYTITIIDQDNKPHSLTFSIK
jgi:hypothetical protein